MNAKVKRLLPFLALLAALPLAVAPCAAMTETETFATGKDWEERMTLRQKIIALIAPSVLFHKYNVPMERPIADYIPTIDRVLMENPYLESEDVSNIFASTLYAYEPESRPALDWMQMEFARRKMIYEEIAAPRLVLIKTPSDDAA